jgi:hypothetical protein
MLRIRIGLSLSCSSNALGCFEGIRAVTALAIGAELALVHIVFPMTGCTPAAQLDLTCYRLGMTIAASEVSVGTVENKICP